jgi:hypothetical protein
LKKLAELRNWLEKSLKEMEAEVIKLRTLLDFVNETLVEKSFKRAELAKPPHAPVEEKLRSPTLTTAEIEVAPPLGLQDERGIPIKATTGELLANLYVNETSMRVVIAEDKRFMVDIPPFTAFLIERVLVKMQEKDREAAGTGDIAPDEILSYSIVSDGNILREIMIRNVDFDRARELRSTIRWTLEKMYEKMKDSA